MAFDGMLEYAEDATGNENYSDKDAPKRVEILDVPDQTAVAKVCAWWGSDHMILVRYDGKWIIVQVLWQTEPES
jgi:hypothetical protein